MPDAEDRLSIIWGEAVMKIMYIGGHIPHKKSWLAVRNTLLLKQLPPWAEYIECYSVQEVKANLDKTDVIFLENLRSTPFWEELKFLEETNCLICASYCDVWRQPWWFRFLRVDVNVVLTQAAAFASFPQEIHDTVYFLPYRVEISHIQNERDIDIIIWGTWHHKAYPFRMFIQKQVQRWIEGREAFCPNDIIGGGLHLYDIELRGHSYKLGYIGAKGGYYGPELFKLLSRCKIACTGPGHKKGVALATGKYYENMACGTVVLTNAFSELEELGFKQGENIWVTDADRFENDLCDLLENSALVERLSVAGKQLVEERYTPQVLAYKFYKFLQQRTGKL